MSSSATKTLHHRETPAFKQVSKQLAKRLHSLRAEKDWTIEVTAEKCGIQPAHVRRIESGNANPSLALLVSVAKAFGLSVVQLLAGEPHE